MTGHPTHLKTLLAAWKREVLPDAFPDLAEWLPTEAPPGAAYWKTMDRIWSGAPWRRHADPSKTVRMMRLG